MIRFLSIILLTFCHLNFYSQHEIIKLSVNPKGGIFKDSVSVKIEGSGDIYYTLDGTYPTIYSKKYRNNSFQFNKTTILRTVQIIDKHVQKEKIVSYIIGREFDMAVISIVGERGDFFDPVKGIYVRGCCADSMPPYRGANFWKHWERQMNVEMFEPNGDNVINQKVGIKIFGGFSRGLPMKSLAVHSRKKYGKKYFKYSIFPNKEIKKYKSFILRNSGSDFNKTHFRDAMVTDLVSSLNMEVQAYRPAVVFINGEYWGIHNIREKINQYFLKGNCDADPDNVDLMKHRNDITDGTRTHYKKMLQYIRGNSFSDSIKLDSLSKLMDIDNFINHNITQVYIDNGDAGGNIRFWRPRTSDGKWRWILFDTDISFGMSNWNAHKVNTLYKMTTKSTEKWPNPSWSTLIIRKLLENDSIQNVYINRIADHLNTIFSSERVNYKIDSIKGLLENEMPFHLEKWRSNSYKKWERNINILKKFATKRPAFLRKFTMSKFDIEDTVNVQISTNLNGYVKLNSIVIKDTFNGVYFKGIPIKIEAYPEEDYYFHHWHGIESSKNPVFVKLSDSIMLEPVFLFKTRSEFSQKIVINEVGINLDSINEIYVEIYNHEENLTLKGWTIKINEYKSKLVDTAQINNTSYYVFKQNIKFELDSVIPILIQLYDHKGFKVDSLFYTIQQTKSLEKGRSLVIERISFKEPITQNNLHFSHNPIPGKINNITILKQSKAEAFWSFWVIIFIVVLLLLFIGLVIYFIKRNI